VSDRRTERRRPASSACARSGGRRAEVPVIAVNDSMTKHLFDNRLWDRSEHDRRNYPRDHVLLDRRTLVVWRLRLVASRGIAYARQKAWART
jgi:S-adenosylhomocysteine hydrolase